MQCPRCQYENLSDAAFCQECGAKLQYICSQCQTDNQPTAKFCRKCGTRLTMGNKAERRNGETAKRHSRVRSLEPRVQKSSEFGVQSSESRPILYTPKHLAQHILAEQAAMEARG